MNYPASAAPFSFGNERKFKGTSTLRIGPLRHRVIAHQRVEFQFGLLLHRSGASAPVVKGRASGASGDFAQHSSQLATAARAGQNRDVSFLFGISVKDKASGWSHGLVSPRLRANPSLEPTRYGRRRLAAPGANGHLPSAAKQRLPQRSPQLER
jgi:hypothetical protein